MTKPIIKIHDVETDEIIEREMTDQEFANYQSMSNHFAERETMALAKATQRQAILDRLGLTAEEAALLLGGN